MQKIQIIDTGEVLPQHAFFDTHPTVAFPLPLTDDVLAEFGARLVAPDPQPMQEPQEVPRWAGILALKRHKLVAGVLALMEPDDAGAGSLHALVIAYRESLPSGEAADRLDAALNDAKDWLRISPTVLQMSALLQLSEAQTDTLFIWAGAQVGTV